MDHDQLASQEAVIQRPLHIIYMKKSKLYKLEILQMPEKSEA